MKTAKLLLCHAATVMSVMLTVFLIINTVNPAMGFYDHKYTRLLILALCAATALIPWLGRRPLIGAIALVLAIGEGTLAVIGFGGGENNVFAGEAGQTACAVFAAFSLVQSVFFTVKDHLRREDQR